MNTDKNWGDMKRRPNPTTLRRSVALAELRTNLRQEFERSVAAMAEDPQIQAECAAIASDFVMATDEHG